MISFQILLKDVRILILEQIFMLFIMKVLNNVSRYNCINYAEIKKNYKRDIYGYNN